MKSWPHGIRSSARRASRVFGVALSGFRRARHASAALLLTVLLDPGVAPAQQPAAPVRFDGGKVVRVRPRDLRDLRTALALTDDVWTCGFGADATSPSSIAAPVDIRLTLEAFAALKASGVPFTLLIDDVQKLIDAEQPPAPPNLAPRGPSFFGAFQNYDSVSAYVDTLVSLRPDIATRVSVGASEGSHAIFGIRIGAPGSPAGSKPAVVVLACQHAREWITVMSAIYIADELVRDYDTDPNVRRMLGSFEFYIVPIANPEGYVYTWTTNRLWRKDRRDNGDGTFGVDLNRNWGYQWGGAGSSGDTSSDIYHGPSAFSEQCTRTLRDFVLAHSNTLLAFDLHSYSQIILEPWGYDYALPPDTRAYSQMTGAIQAAMSGAAGGFFYGGETYRAIYPASGCSHDWVAGSTSAIGYGFELRDRGNYGFVLPPAQIMPGSSEAAAGVFAGVNWLIANTISVTFSAGQPGWLPASSSTSIRVQFSRGFKPLGDPSTHVPTVYSRIGRNAPFVASAPMISGTDEGGPVFTHSLVSGPCGGVTQWYYNVPLPDGTTATLPPGGANAPYEAVSRGATTVFSDDFEADRGWLVGDFTTGSPDTASTGIWIRTDPNGTPAQPEYDHTPLAGVNCFITGQNPRGNIDNGRLGIGKTTLRSPVFSAGGAAAIDASFWLWTDTGGTETFTIDATGNANASTPTWVNALTINSASPNWQTTPRWNHYVIRLSDLVAPSSTMRLRFIANASNGSALMEAALDDVTIVEYSCLRAICAGDYNADGLLTVQDIFDYLNDWFAAAPRANIDGGGLSVQDIFDFLTSWFTGCP